MPIAQYVVTFKDGQWMITFEDKRYGPYRTQADAIKIAIGSAQMLGQNGHNAQVLVQGTDSKFRTEWTYGKDPFPPRG